MRELGREYHQREETTKSSFTKNWGDSIGLVIKSHPKHLSASAHAYMPCAVHAPEMGTQKTNSPRSEFIRQAT